MGGIYTNINKFLMQNYTKLSNEVVNILCNMLKFILHKNNRYPYSVGELWSETKLCLSFVSTMRGQWAWGISSGIEIGNVQVGYITTQIFTIQTWTLLMPSVL